MMLPATAFSSSSSSSANSAVVRVDKATSEFLNGPDWTLNIDICDTINANPWLAKDVVKAVKKRLQHKNPHVQLLSLTLLETMVKNCGEHVHFQIAERNILPEMIKIVKKKTDMRVREKILVLLDSWQEAFGGRGGRYPQYYFAYDELRQSGVQFPQRSPDAAPIFTPPVTHPSFRPPQANYGMPINSSTRLDEAMASEIENLSVSTIESMRNVSDLLSEMLQEVDPNDRAAIKDEVIVDVVDRCRSNQKKLMQMLASTSDEELLGQGIELNDHLQIVLAKHDAIASGSPLPIQISSSIAPPPIKPNEEKQENTKESVAVTPPATPLSKSQLDEGEEEEDEDDFALLARRHSKAQTGASQNGAVVNEPGPTPDSSMSMALTLTDPPPPVNTTRADDMIDFLSLTLSSVNTTSPQSPPSSQAPPPVTSPPNIHQSPQVSAAAQNYPHQTQPTLSSYVVPWAQPEPQTQPQSQPQAQPRYQPQPQQQVQPQYQPQPQPQPQAQPQYQPQPQPQAQPRYQPQPQPQAQAQYQQPNYSSGYNIPPPWAATPGYYTNNPYATNAFTSYNNVPSQQTNYYSSNARAAAGSSNAATAAGGGGASQRPFIPSYRLFEDLNVLGNPKTSGTSGSSSGQSMMGGKK